MFTNYADLLTKFDIQKQTPSVWIDLQLQIMRAEWLQRHPWHWESQLLVESRKKIGVQISGGSLMAPQKDKDSVNSSTTSHSDHINFLTKLNPHSNLYPAADWSVIDSLVNKYMSKPISTCFRVLGFVVWFGQKWLDTIRIKQHKLNNHCFHPHIFCKHGIDFIKSTSTCDRPFLEMENIVRENDRITQVSDQTEQWLCRTGLDAVASGCV